MQAAFWDLNWLFGQNLRCFVYMSEIRAHQKFFTEEFIEGHHLVNNFVSHCFATNAMCEAETGFQIGAYRIWPNLAGRC